MGVLEEGPGSAGGPAELFMASLKAYESGSQHEGITEVIPVTVSEFERMIRESEITDSFTIIAFLYAKLHNLL